MSPPRFPDTRPASARQQPPDRVAPRTSLNTAQPPHAAGAAPARDTARLELPHERDQNLDATAAQPEPVIEQAARDLQQGQVDTDLRATPGLDAERRARLLKQRR